MKNLVSFFEIPATDFERAVKFYESVFGVKLEKFEGNNEKMAFFPNYEGAISQTEGFHPSSNGVLISLCSKDICETLEKVIANAGSVVINKTAIESDKKGHFAVFIDCEGNRIGLHEKLS